eukprot:CAMPEP_0201623866 /NCGR_PEP_ID=MMETSP0493-20130528/229_1 /ASSEMBLY_ACC=CAM_ASM_000838 /TAXON_ID=420259 /ORGANISM="Thalassiosira gravida, Strain GMp14c1" /LENGTH=111 /DNA_ID=CAMNT_0048093577 /DNA_START=526 /DNA_END=858 /DNA_ORIENTATION=-
MASDEEADAIAAGAGTSFTSAAFLPLWLPSPMTPPPTHRARSAVTAPARRAKLGEGGGGKALAHFDEHQTLQSQGNNLESNFERLTNISLGMAEQNAEVLAGMAQSAAVGG